MQSSINHNNKRKKTSSSWAKDSALAGLSVCITFYAGLAVAQVQLLEAAPPLTLSIVAEDKTNDAKKEKPIEIQDNIAINTLIIDMPTKEKLDDFAPEKTIDQMIREIARLPLKETLQHQGLIDVPISAEQFNQIVLQESIQPPTETGTVIKTVGSTAVCIADGQYVIDDSRYDKDQGELRVDFRLDETQPFALCDNFTNILSTTECVIKDSATITSVTDGRLHDYMHACVTQMKNFL